MAVGMRALLDTVIQALPQVGNLGLLFMLLFFIFAALGVELFGDLICDDLHPCEGLGRYATFKNFGMAFLLLFRVSTGDNWNGIMKDTLRDCAHDNGTCYNTVVSPIYFVSFVLTAQFVLVNVVIAVLMKHLEESNKEAKEEAELEAEMELEAVGGDGGMTGGHISPLALRDIGGHAGSRWISRDSQDRGYPDSPSAVIRRDSTAHKIDQSQGLGPPLQRRPMFDSVSLVIQGSLEGELSLMDNLSGSICHYYALPPLPSKYCNEKQIPLAEMEALSLASEKSWSLALTDDSVPDDINPLLLTSLECNNADPSEPSTESVRPHEYLEEHLLCVKKTSVGRAHSLPNDSYMFLPHQPIPSSTTLMTSAQQTQSGSVGSVQSQTEEPAQHLTVPTDLFRPISPHSLSDSECIPRIPPPRRGHTLSRTLRRQVAVSTDSQEALHTKGGENEGPQGLGELSAPPATFPALQQFPQPSLFFVPATPGASPKPVRGSVHTQHNPHDQYNICSRHQCASPSHDKPAEENSVDQEVSQIIQSGLGDHRNQDCVKGGGTGGGLCEGNTPSPRQLKKYHSADVQSRRAPLLLPRPSSWVDDPRRHSIEVCPSVENSPQRSSVSSGFVSRADSLQQPSPRTHKKKKMSPPCISVDPPEGLVLPRDFQIVMDTGMGTMPPSLPCRDTCLRRRAPSSESKDSFELGLGGDGLSQEGVPNPKLLTLPNFSFEKTSSEH